MSGVVHGGVEFVIAAYAVTALVFAGYALSIFLRHREEERRAEQERDR
jgi:hypothetical protein